MIQIGRRRRISPPIMYIPIAAIAPNKAKFIDNFIKIRILNQIKVKTPIKPACKKIVNVELCASQNPPL